METLSTIYNETSVRPDHIKYTAEAVTEIVQDYVVVLNHRMSKGGVITLDIEGDPVSVDAAVKALKTRGFSKPIRITTDRKSIIRLDS